MAYKIVPSSCTGCGSCEMECPNKAIKAKGDIFEINPDKCTECKGKFAFPQCVAACPADAIIHA
ncbi:MAG: 4Fe-4S binding protein [Rhodospirillales bacterium]|nr:4Fe-4S binding protein [Rhodospirillales bacterium]